MLFTRGFERLCTSHRNIPVRSPDKLVDSLVPALRKIKLSPAPEWTAFATHSRCRTPLGHLADLKLQPVIVEYGHQSTEYPEKDCAGQQEREQRAK